MKTTFHSVCTRQAAGMVHLLGVVCLITGLVGCASPLRPQDVQARDTLEALQPNVCVEVTGDDFSLVTATGLTDINRARFVDGMATGCVEASGELRGMSKTPGWVCFLPDTGQEAFAVIYTPTALQLLRPVGASAGFAKELSGYGYAQGREDSASQR